jgi:peptidoglycan hydrolase-like protein with peptidoglycan-binding domain
VLTVAAFGPAFEAPIVTASPLVASPPSIVGLSEGARGNDVKAVQNALITAGVPVPGGADGIYGPATKSAVTAFQSRTGLAANGQVDAATAAALGLSQAAPAASAGGALTVGAQGPAVAELQRALMAAGVYLPGGADGIFGAATTKAISSFQRWNGLPITGVVDAATSTRLKPGTATTPAAAPTPAPATPSTTFVGLTTGARGENVKVVQRALIAAGITVRGGADGIYGAMTAAAVSAYQQAKGLAVTGSIDEATATSLALTPPVSPAPAAPAAPAPAAPAAPAANPFVGMTVGAQGDNVKALQRALLGTGLVLRGGADGVFGAATRAALVSFQKVNGRPETGVVSETDASQLALGAAQTPATTPQGVSGSVGHAVFGERGSRVTTLQQALIAAGITVRGGADGIFGAATAGAILEFQRRHGLTPTGKMDDATAAKLGATPAAAPAPPSSAGVTIEVFPVQGRCWFGDTWHAPRGGGRLHEGVDIIAAKGNLLYAAVSGRISKQYFDFPGSLAGNGLRILQDNGTYVTYLHMDSFASGITVGATVTAGQVVGTVGNTGNSATAHLHFEVHPGGGAAVNPYPIIKPLDACAVTAPRA